MRFPFITRSERVGPRVWNILILNRLGLLKKRSALYLPAYGSFLDMMINRASTVRIDLILSFMICLIRFGDRSPSTSGGGRGFVEGPLQDSNKANDKNIGSVCRVQSLKAFISSPGPSRYVLCKTKSWNCPPLCEGYRAWT